MADTPEGAAPVENPEDDSRKLGEALAALGRVADKVGGAKVLGDALTSLVAHEVRRTVESSTTAANRGVQKAGDEAKPVKSKWIDVRQRIEQHAGDSERAFAEIRKSIAEHLKTGKVSFWVDNKQVPIIRQDDQGRHYDEKNQQWGLMPLAMGTTGSKSGIELHEPTATHLTTGPTRPTPSEPSSRKPFDSSVKTVKQSQPGELALEDLRKAAEQASFALGHLHDVAFSIRRQPQESTSTPTPANPTPEERIGDRKKAEGPWGRVWSKVKNRISQTKIGKSIGRVGRATKIGHSLGRSLGLGVARVRGLNRTKSAAAARTGASVGGAVGGSVGMVGGLSAVTMALVQFDKRLIEASEAAIQAGLRFKEFSGLQAVNAALKDVYDLRRNQHIGDQTAASTRSLIQSDARRQNAEADIEIAFRNSINLLLDLMNRAITPLLEDVAAVARTFNKLLPDLASFLGTTLEDEGRVGIAAAVADLVAQVNAAEARARNLMDVERNRGIPARPVPRPPGGR